LGIPLVKKATVYAMYATPVVPITMNKTARKRTKISALSYTLVTASPLGAIGRPRIPNERTLLSQSLLVMFRKPLGRTERLDLKRLSVQDTNGSKAEAPSFSNRFCTRRVPAFLPKE